MRVLMLCLVALSLAACRSNRTEPIELPEASETDRSAEQPVRPRQLIIGDIGTKTYHRAGCEHLTALDETEQQLFEDPGEAQDRNFHPCRTCRPLRDW